MRLHEAVHEVAHEVYLIKATGWVIVMNIMRIWFRVAVVMIITIIMTGD